MPDVLAPARAVAPRLAPVPIPARYRWLAFRRAALPVLVFLASLGAVALLWGNASGHAFVAEADADRVELGATVTAEIDSLAVGLNQSVEAGQLIATLRTTRPDVAAATLAALRAETLALEKSLAPALEPQRVAADVARLQLDWHRERVSLAALHSQAELATSDLRRLEALHAQQLVSTESYETAKNLHARLTHQLAAQRTLVSTVEPAATQLAVPLATSQQSLAAALRAQHEKLRAAELQLAPTPLVAPFGGVVALLHRRSGETVAAGQPVVTLVAGRPTRLTAFIRQPLSARLRTGATVEVRLRRTERIRLRTRIVSVGHALEPIPSHHLATQSPRLEIGLRVELALPSGLQLHPGELVDVAWSAPEKS